MIRTELRPNQRVAVDGALRHDGYAFFSEQRVGKCLPSLAVADERKPDIVFICCPKGALDVWRKQIREHLKIDWRCKLVLIHYEALCRRAKDRRKYRHLFRHEWAGKTLLLIVDEAHRIKRRGSMQSRMLRSLGEMSTYVLALSGTPIDKYQDYWAQFDLIQPGVLEDEYEDFQEMYLEMGGYKNREVVGHKNVERFLSIVHRYSYRITLREAQIEAGRKPYVVKRSFIRFDLKPESRRIYNELQDELETEVQRRKIRTPLVITLVQKLQQIAGGYLIHKEQIFKKDGTPKLKNEKPVFEHEIVPVGREKMLHLERLITMNSVFSDEKFVICANYTHEINAIARRLRRLGRTYRIVSGKGSYEGKFDTDCVLLQIRSGEAIDLADARTYVFYSWNWSYINFSQSRFRVLKFTSRLVRYFFLIANDTVDQEIYDAVMQKRKLAELIADRYRWKRAA